MDPFFGFQESVGVLAFDHVFRTLDTGFIARKHVQLLDSKAFRFSPFDIHTDQHLGPVLGFGTACPGMERDDGVVRIIGFAQKKLDLLFVKDLFQLIKLCLDFRLHPLIIFLDGKIQKILQAFRSVKEAGVCIIGILGFCCCL